jgi:hypothetical protein
MTVPYTFANISGQIPLSELDANFAAVSAYSNTAGTVTASAQPNIASVGTLTTLTVSGNVTADYVIGNIIGSISNAVYANTAGIATSANIANVANIAYSVSGANVSGTVANATYAVTANSASYANLAITATVANTANGVAGANVTGTVANATYAVTANVATYAGTVTTNAQPNITSVGNLTNLTVSGNSTVINNSTVGANIVVDGYANIGSYISAVGNVTGNNFSALGAISTNSYLSATGNITGGNLLTTGQISSSGNVSTGSNLLVSGYESVSGNITTSGELVVATQNAHGGAGYAGMLTMTNTTANTTNPNKFVRLSNIGALEIVNSDYTQTILSLNNSGNLTVTGTVTGANLLLNQTYPFNFSYGANVNANTSATVPYSGPGSAFLTFTLPSAGTWVVAPTVRGILTQAYAQPNFLSFALYQNGNLVPNTETMVRYDNALYISGQSEGCVSATFIVNTTTSTTYTLNAFGGGLQAPVILSDGNGRTTVSRYRIG